MRFARRGSTNLPLLAMVAVPAVAALGLVVFLLALASNRVYRFPGVSGPGEKTVVSTLSATSWQRYRNGSASRLAILLTDPDSAWLGLAHGLKGIGVPFCITTDYREALQHRVVLVYPVISGKVLDSGALKALAQHPKNGGTLMAVNVLGGGLQELFGFHTASPARGHYELRFDRRHPLAASFTDPREETIRIGSRLKGAQRGSYNYLEPALPPLAVYEDGAAAITWKPVGKGAAYAFGIDLGALVLTGHNDREEGISRCYVNGFEPSLDVLLRFLKGIYLAGEGEAVTLGTVPENRSLAVMMTHDIDYGGSVQNALNYAAFEKGAKVRGTYFMQTKYVRDWNDEAFFTTDGVRSLYLVAELGMEVGSHSVSHAGTFNHFPLGDGTESYPSYAPIVLSERLAHRGTVLGELRVSKFLLEKFTNRPVLSFRPGHLRNPFTLPQALSATGYRFSSSATANNVLTHLPYQANQDRDVHSEVDIFEFPVTIEDEQTPSLCERLIPSVELARSIARYGGSCVVLIHPNVLGDKLDFEKRFVEAVRPFSWFGSLSDYGSWWSLRNQIQVDVAGHGGRHVVTLGIPGPITGLTLQVPPGWRLKSGSAAGVKATQIGNKVVLGEARGSVVLEMTSTGEVL